MKPTKEWEDEIEKKTVFFRIQNFNNKKNNTNIESLEGEKNRLD